MDLGELNDIRLALRQIMGQLHPGREQTNRSLPAPRRAADFVPAPLPAIGTDGFTGVWIEQTPEIQQVVHLKIMRKVRQLIVLPGDQSHVQALVCECSTELIRVMHQSAASI